MSSPLKVGDRVVIKGFENHDTVIIGFITDRGIFTSAPMEFVSVLIQNTAAPTVQPQQFTVHNSLLELKAG